MLRIDINKSPILYIEIPADLKELKVYSDCINCSQDDPNEELKVRDKVISLIHGGRPGYAQLLYQGNRVELYGLVDIDQELRELRTKYPLQEHFEVYSDLHDAGIHHYIQCPINSLHNNGYLSDQTHTEITKYIEERVFVLRKLKEDTIHKNANNIAMIKTALDNFDALNPYPMEPRLDCSRLVCVASVLTKLMRDDGEIEHCNEDLLYLLQNEDIVDDLLRQRQYVPYTKILLAFRDQVSDFVKCNEVIIHRVIQKYIHECKPFFQAMYGACVAKIANPHPYSIASTSIFNNRSNNRRSSNVESNDAEIGSSAILTNAK